jgi:hypothetical protein
MKKQSAPKPSKCCSSLSIGMVCVIGFWVVAVAYFHHRNRSIISTAALSIQTFSSVLSSKTDLTERIIRIEVENSVPLKKDGEPIGIVREVEPPVHVVFSTDCTFFQDWQTLLVFHSAVVIGQRGNITRIASGCTDEKMLELRSLYARLFPQYDVHFTPDFKKDKTTGKKYDFYNKPYGLLHWLENAVRPIPSGTVVALIDPDMLFMRPLTARLANEPANIFLKSFNPGSDKVPLYASKGNAVAQLYGLGAPWTNDRSKSFNRTEICGVHSPCLDVSNSFGEAHFR